MSLNVLWMCIAAVWLTYEFIKRHDRQHKCEIENTWINRIENDKIEVRREIFCLTGNYTMHTTKKFDEIEKAKEYAKVKRIISVQGQYKEVFDHDWDFLFVVALMFVSCINTISEMAAFNLSIIFTWLNITRQAPRPRPSPSLSPPRRDIIENYHLKECAICLEVLGNGPVWYCSTKCGNAIHEACYEELIDHNDFCCPSCREHACFSPKNDGIVEFDPVPNIEDFRATNQPPSAVAWNITPDNSEQNLMPRPQLQTLQIRPEWRISDVQREQQAEIMRQAERNRQEEMQRMFLQQQQQPEQQQCMYLYEEGLQQQQPQQRLIYREEDRGQMRGCTYQT